MIVLIVSCCIPGFEFLFPTQKIYFLVNVYLWNIIFTFSRQKSSTKTYVSMGHLFHSYVKQPSRVNPSHRPSPPTNIEPVAGTSCGVPSYVCRSRFTPWYIYIYICRLINNIGGNYLYTLSLYIYIIMYTVLYSVYMFIYILYSGLSLFWTID